VGARGVKPLGKGRKGRRSFLEKRTKKLLFICSVVGRLRRVQMNESIFASFSSEKEESFFA